MNIPQEMALYATFSMTSYLMLIELGANKASVMSATGWLIVAFIVATLSKPVLSWVGARGEVDA